MELRKKKVERPVFELQGKMRPRRVVAALIEKKEVEIYRKAQQQRVAQAPEHFENASRLYPKVSSSSTLPWYQAWMAR